VCACVGEDLHEMGLRCASYIFESEGWMVIYLGARIPPEAVGAAITELKPDLACLSVTHPAQGGQEALGEITRGAREGKCRVILGGRVASSLSLPPGSIDAVHDSAKGLLDYIAVFDRVVAALKTI
jgi:methanogenic corrinoid protein MtbC1